jgi:hypothetical protein
MKNNPDVYFIDSTSRVAVTGHEGETENWYARIEHAGVARYMVYEIVGGYVRWTGVDLKSLESAIVYCREIGFDGELESA